MTASDGKKSDIFVFRNACVFSFVSSATDFFARSFVVVVRALRALSWRCDNGRCRRRRHGGVQLLEIALGALRQLRRRYDNVERTQNTTTTRSFINNAHACDMCISQRRNVPAVRQLDAFADDDDVAPALLATARSSAPLTCTGRFGNCARTETIVGRNYQTSLLRHQMVDVGRRAHRRRDARCEQRRRQRPSTPIHTIDEISKCRYSIER